MQMEGSIVGVECHRFLFPLQRPAQIARNFAGCCLEHHSSRLAIRQFGRLLQFASRLVGFAHTGVMKRQVMVVDVILGIQLQRPTDVQGGTFQIPKSHILTSERKPTQSTVIGGIVRIKLDGLFVVWSDFVVLLKQIVDLTTFVVRLRIAGIQCH